MDSSNPDSKTQPLLDSSNGASHANGPNGNGSNKPRADSKTLNSYTEYIRNSLNGQTLPGSKRKSSQESAQLNESRSDSANGSFNALRISNGNKGPVANDTGSGNGRGSSSSSGNNLHGITNTNTIQNRSGPPAQQQSSSDSRANSLSNLNPPVVISSLNLTATNLVKVPSIEKNLKTTQDQLDKSQQSQSEKNQNPFSVNDDTPPDLTPETTPIAVRSNTLQQQGTNNNSQQNKTQNNIRGGPSSDASSNTLLSSVVTGGQSQSMGLNVSGTQSQRRRVSIQGNNDDSSDNNQIQGSGNLILGPVRSLPLNTAQAVAAARERFREERSQSQTDSPTSMDSRNYYPRGRATTTYIRSNLTGELLLGGAGPGGNNVVMRRKSQAAAINTNSESLLDNDMRSPYSGNQSDGKSSLVSVPRFSEKKGDFSLDEVYLTLRSFVNQYVMVALLNALVVFLIVCVDVLGNEYVFSAGLFQISERGKAVFYTLDLLTLILFTMEVLVNLGTYGRKEFFADFYHKVDFGLVVAVNLVYILTQLFKDEVASENRERAIKWLNHQIFQYQNEQQQIFDNNHNNGTSTVTLLHGHDSGDDFPNYVNGNIPLNDYRYEHDPIVKFKNIFDTSSSDSNEPNGFNNDQALFPGGISRKAYNRALHDKILEYQSTSTASETFEPIIDIIRSVLRLLRLVAVAVRINVVLRGSTSGLAKRLESILADEELEYEDV